MAGVALLISLLREIKPNAIVYSYFYIRPNEIENNVTVLQQSRQIMEADNPGTSPHFHAAILKWGGGGYFACVEVN